MFDHVDRGAVFAAQTTPDGSPRAHAGIWIFGGNVAFPFIESDPSHVGAHNSQREEGCAVLFGAFVGPFKQFGANAFPSRPWV